MIRRTLILNPGAPDQAQVELTLPFYQLGRSEEAAIRVDSRGVSALHASLLVKPDRVLIVDLDSTNGTFVNDRKTKNAELKNGDVIRLADRKLEYREERTGASLEAGNTATLFTPISAANADRLEALYGALELTLSATDRPGLVKAVLGEIRRLLDLDLCGLFLQDESLFYVLEGAELKTEAKSASISATILEQVLSTGAAVFLEHVGNDSKILGFQSLIQFKIQSMLCVPVKNGAGEVLGALYCVSRQKAELDMVQKDRLLLKAFSSLISLSIKSMDRREEEASAAKDLERKRQEGRFLPLLSRLRQEKENLSLKGAEAPEGLFGLDRPENTPLREFIVRAARTDLPVLLTGETGTGKTLAARFVHSQGRPQAPFVVIDCTTIPAELLESELFGHEKGAFTGAHARREGRVARAGGGTIFMDEIGELPLALQAKLLGLIQTGEYEAVGGLRKEKINARFIFATNRNLKEEVKAGRFREDLYFRLNVLMFGLPALRERPGLILPLADHFLSIHGGRAAPKAAFSEKAREALIAHPWPGNVRELENAILRGLLHAQAGTIEAADLALAEYSAPSGQALAGPAAEAVQGDSLDLKEARERLDQVFIRKALALTERNVSAAARTLNISRNSLIDLIKKYEI